MYTNLPKCAIIWYNKQYKNVKVERNEKGEIKLRKYIIGKFNN